MNAHLVKDESGSMTLVFADGQHSSAMRIEDDSLSSSTGHFEEVTKQALAECGRTGSEQGTVRINGLSVLAALALVPLLTHENGFKGVHVLVEARAKRYLRLYPEDAEFGHRVSLTPP